MEVPGVSFIRRFLSRHGKTKSIIKYGCYSICAVLCLCYVDQTKEDVFRTIKDLSSDTNNRYHGPTKLDESIHHELKSLPKNIDVNCVDKPSNCWNHKNKKNNLHSLKKIIEKKKIFSRTKFQMNRYELDVLAAGVPKNPKPDVDIPKRIVSRGNALSFPKKSLYGDDKIVLKNLTWTVFQHRERRLFLQQRKRQVTQQCRKRNIAYHQHSTDTWEGMRWSSKHHLLWCPVFKAASTTWMKNYLIIAEETEVEGSLHARVRELFPAPKSRAAQNKALKNSLKFLIVRHPFERLLSAYRDKMLRELKVNDIYREIQKEIIRDYGNITVNNYDIKPTNKINYGSEKYNPEYRSPRDFPTSLTTGNKTTAVTKNKKHNNEKYLHPTFMQFLLRVREDLINLLVRHRISHTDAHWMPISQSCSPCVFKYDVIAHVETLSEDQEYIIREAGLKGILVNAVTHSSRFDKYATTNDAERAYFGEVPLILLQELAKLYKPDFTIFGYDPDIYFRMAKVTKSPTQSN